LFLAIINLNEN